MAAPNSPVKPYALIAEDSRIQAKILENRLIQGGYEVAVAGDGGKALELARQRKPDIIISDIEMPAMDGYTLTTEIRRHPGLAGLYVLLHTSLSGVFNNAMVERVGANAFVAKYSPHELAEHVLFRLNQVAAAQMAAA